MGKWFARRLDVAMGVFSVLVGIGFIAAFPAVGQAALAFGWRPAWLAVGVVQILLIAPLAWLFVRDDPETAGLVVDGDEAAAERDGSPTDLTVWEALQTAAFWMFALSSSLFGLVYSGIALFNQSILEERGFDATTFHQVLVISTLVGLAANFAGGVLAARWPIQRVMGLGMAVLACALVGLPAVRTTLHVVLYGIAMGVAGGVVTVVFFSVWGRVFGRSHLGRIQGCAQMMTVFASAAGPLLLAETLARTGSYAGIFYGLAVVVVALGLGCWWVALPSRAAARTVRVPRCPRLSNTSREQPRPGAPIAGAQSAADTSARSTFTRNFCFAITLPSWSRAIVHLPGTSSQGLSKRHPVKRGKRAFIGLSHSSTRVLLPVLGSLMGGWVTRVRNGTRSRNSGPSMRTWIPMLVPRRARTWSGGARNSGVQ